MSKARIAAATLVVATLAVASGVLGQGTGAPATASAWVQLDSARVRLLAGPPAAKSGKAYLAGVEVVLAEGWKTYWRSPGDAGVPPSFEWTGSRNVAAVNVRYPVPSRHREATAISIGYDGTVLFPVEVVPQDAAKPVDLALSMNFGVCREICIPAEAKMAVTLTPAQLKGDAAPALLAALARVPRPTANQRSTDPKLEKVSADLDGDRPRLVIEAKFSPGSRGTDVFIETPDGIYVPQPTRLPDVGGLAQFEVDLSRGGNARELSGKVVTLTLVSEAGATEATWTLPKL